MLKRLLPLVLIVVALLADTLIVPLFGGHWLMPLFALDTVIALGVLLGRTRGTLYGLIVGLIVDILVSTPLGLMTILYTGLGYFSGWIGRRHGRNPLAPAAAGLLCLCIFEIAMAGYQLASASAFAPVLIRQALLRIALGTLVVTAMRFVYRRILRPGSPGADAR